MSTLHHVLRPTVFALALALALPSLAADKQRIEREADIPQFSYVLTDKLEKVVRDPVLFAKVVQPMRADIQAVLDKYDIADKASQRRYMSTLASLDFLAGNYDGALAGAEKVRLLEDKPANKHVSGLRLRAMSTAAKSTGGQLNTPAYLAAVAAYLDRELAAMPYEVVANDLKGFKSNAETLGEGVLMGTVNDEMQATVDKTGAFSSTMTAQLVSIRLALTNVMPIKSTLVGSYSAYLNKHKVEKADMWAARDVALPAKGAYSPVNVAIWDSGVDSKLFPGQMLMKGKQPVLFATDLESRPTTGQLFPIPAALQPKLPEMLARTKGFSDLQSNIDSPEASEVKLFMSSLKAQDFKGAVEPLGLAGNYVHGTHVAGIAAAGNPWVRLATVRLSYDYKLQPSPCPSMALAERGAKAHQATAEFLKRHKVRVVNMSWGGSVRDYEAGLQKCGIGKTLDERKTLARTYFEMEKAALTKAFSSAPEILFITAAGNNNSDSSFAEFIPSSIVLPNLLTVGAVDKAGDEAPFTSYGPTVAVHANGYQVESYLPGGKRVALSGTSMAAPNVANLAAKLLAVKPALTPVQVIAIIRETAETTADGRRILINPAKALARLQP
ncbi:MAG: S8 family serine peptidase [Pseudomonadota bacterium]